MRRRRRRRRCPVPALPFGSTSCGLARSPLPGGTRPIPTHPWQPNLRSGRYWRARRLRAGNRPVDGDSGRHQAAGPQRRGGTATVDLSNDFRADGAALSAVPMQLRVAEVVCTLTQFAGVDQVTITVDGKPLDGAANLKRADVDAVLPRILIESPVPGEAVTSPLKVSGIANVFEGTVTYSVNAPDGAELDQGFTTVTGLEWGNWGPFAFTSNYSTQQHGLGRVTVWEVSMKDGSHRNVYEVPVNF
ncbi:immunoglobulin-like domain of bacterial spore germination family protein [Mycobacterium kansasii]|uniref:Immunoglobulin-like domain of bacterial spore germination family protein n=1 Tax=Mycobacterium kansasii TaxID=1768 RepID=A0A1V3XR24_MYCKA|nr:immunoglobulin-like domain of bacterial spore germination family protein [Mycobacterium kansasii]